MESTIFNIAISEVTRRSRSRNRFGENAPTPSAKLKTDHNCFRQISIKKHAQIH